MSRVPFISLLLLSVCITAGCSRPVSDATPNAVAVVDGSEISIEEFRREYIDHLLGSGLKDNLRRRYSFLNRMVGMKLLVREARCDGYADTEAYRYQEQVTSSKLMVDLLLERTVFERMSVSEAELQEMLVRVNTQTKARHLYARSLSEAERVHARLMAGERFEDLALEVFEDPVLSENGGSLGYFSFDEMDPEFEDAAFGLRIGEISTPVRTSRGYSIVQVEDRFVKPILTEMEFATRKDRLEIYVRERKRKAARKEYLQSILEGSSPEFEEDTVKRLFGTISGLRLEGSVEAEEELPGRILVTFTENGVPIRWTVSEFRNQAALASSAQRMAVETEADLRAFITGLLGRAIMVDRAEEMDLDDDPSFREALDHEMASWLYERAYYSVLKAIEIESDTVESYYQKFRSEFTRPERIRVREILVASRADADRAMRALGSSPFSDVARDYSLRPGSDRTGGDLGPVTRTQLGVLADRVFDAEVGATIGPIDVDNRFVILQIGEREPARQASVEEVHDEIVELVRQQRKQSALKLRIDDLKERFDTMLHRDRLATIQLADHVSS